MHGWLDNAASFDLLAPLLTDCHVLAVDSAGHGLSGPRSADAAYNIWQEVGDMVEAADQMGWERFTVMGHSRGANVAVLIAGTFPERIERVILIEGGVPTVGSAEEAPETLAQALRDRRELSRKSGRIFAKREAAIEARTGGWSKISRQAAEVLASRALRKVPGGFQWHVDQRVKGRSEVRLTRDQARAFIERVRAPVLLVLAEDSPIGTAPLFEDLVPLFPRFHRVDLPGGHHLHLEGAQTTIAERILAFLPPGVGVGA